MSGRGTAGRAWRAIFMAAAVLVMAAWVQYRIPAVLAQPAAEPPAGAVPAGDPASAGGAGTAGAPTGGNAGTTAGPARGRRTLLHQLVESGFVGLLIVLTSMVAVGFIIEHFITIRKGVLMPARVLADLEQMIAARQIDDAIDYCRRPENYSLATSVVLAGLERYQGSQFGFAEYKAAAEEAGEEQTSRLYRKTEVLGLIGAIAPMLGLLGTVQGMILAFNTIADKAGMARPEDLAGAIGLALVTTFEGLVVAIPTMVAFSFFRNRIDSIVAEAGNRVERIMLPLGRQK
jgi:biopolymer transport protein ExbB